MEQCLMSRSPTDADGQLPEAVLQTLVENHQRFLNFLRRRVGSDHEAEEILQAAMLKGVEKSAEIRSERSTIAWFYRLLRNALVDQRRTRASETRALEHETREQPEPVVHDTDTMICACMDELVETLKPEYVTALKRVELEGVGIQKFALETGITVNNARVRVHRAREALRKQLLETCGACTKEMCLSCLCRKAAQKAAADTAIDGSRS
jgi:RNA polymerase sigma factor (sigma-70 family)